MEMLKDGLEGNIRGLESMDIKSDIYGCFYATSDAETTRGIRCFDNTRTISEPWDLQYVISTFNKELKLREQCMFCFKGCKSNS